MPSSGREAPAKSGVVEINDFRFDFDRVEFRCSEQTIGLSETEQRLLRLLVENRGRPLSRAVLMERMWTGNAKYVEEKALSVAVKRLWDKLEENPI